MNCAKTEERLSEYMESSLPAEDMKQVNHHLQTCAQCMALYEEMRSAISLCRSFPILDLDLDLADRILLRTSGRPRRRSFREILKRYPARPLIVPRFAAGARSRVEAGLASRGIPRQDKTGIGWGIFLIILGVVFLAQNIIPYYFLNRLWPLLFVGIGAYLVYRALREKEGRAANAAPSPLANRDSGIKEDI